MFYPVASLCLSFGVTTLNNFDREDLARSFEKVRDPGKIKFRSAATTTLTEEKF